MDAKNILLDYVFTDRAGRDVFHMKDSEYNVIGQMRLLPDSDFIHDEVWVHRTETNGTD